MLAFKALKVWHLHQSKFNKLHIVLMSEVNVWVQLDRGNEWFNIKLNMIDVNNYADTGLRAAKCLFSAQFKVQRSAAFKAAHFQQYF